MAGVSHSIMLLGVAKNGGWNGRWEEGRKEWRVVRNGVVIQRGGI